MKYNIPLFFDDSARNYLLVLSPTLLSTKLITNKLIDDNNANIQKLKWTSNGKSLLLDIDHAYNNPDIIGPKILPNAANDCEIPLTLPKYFFSVELFIIKLTKTTEVVANDPLKIKKIHILYYYLINVYHYIVLTKYINKLLKLIIILFHLFLQLFMDIHLSLIGI